MQPEPNPAAGAVPPGPALVYMPVQTTPRTYDRYQRKQSIGLGITQIIISILCVIFNSVCIGVSRYGDNGLGSVGHGYWCGILFMITGIFGVIAGKNRTSCPIIAFMVLCVISAAFTIAVVTVGIIGALTIRDYDCRGYGYYYENYYPSYRSPCSTLQYYQVIVAMESCLAILGFIEAIVAIWGSALCCGSGVCCCSNPTQAVGYLPNTGQMIYISQGQGVPYICASQPTLSFPQGLVPPPSYAQQGWAMPSTNIGPVFGQAPPAYTTNSGQPIWIIPPAATNQGAVAAQAPPTASAPNQEKERV